MIPGVSRSCMLAPLYRNTPGIQVNVVNSTDEISLLVSVNLVSIVDLPTDGNLMS